ELARRASEGKRLCAPRAGPIRKREPIVIRPTLARRASRDWVTWRDLVLEPPRRHLQRPDFAAEGLRVTAGDPEFVLEDVRRVFVAFFPDHLGLQLCPVLAVFRVPHISPVLRRIVRPASQDPDAVAVNGRRKPESRRLWRGLSF